MDSLILSENLHADKLVELYQQERILVGRDAFYCAYNHPDSRLRSALDISYPLVNGKIHDPHGYLHLLRHALDCAAETLGIADLTQANTIFSYKPTLSDEDCHVLADTIFSRPHCETTYFVNECSLAVDVCRLRSALVIDIGATSSYAVAVVDGVVVPKSIRTSAVGK